MSTSLLFKRVSVHAQTSDGYLVISDVADVCHAHESSRPLLIRLIIR